MGEDGRAVTPSWAKAEKVFADGRVAYVVAMVYTYRLTISSSESAVSGCYDDGWCYTTEYQAVTALNNWDGQGEPTGWHRHPPSGRRRPNGDAAQEYVNW